jgi:hypothetical protein
MAIARKGEFSVVVGPETASEAPAVRPSDDDIIKAFRSFNEPGRASGKRAAAGAVAKRLGLTANEVYKALERAKL